MHGVQPGPWHFKAISSRHFSRWWDRERVKVMKEIFLLLALPLQLSGQEVFRDQTGRQAVHPSCGERAALAVSGRRPLLKQTQFIKGWSQWMSTKTLVYFHVPQSLTGHRGS